MQANQPSDMNQTEVPSVEELQAALDVFLAKTGFSDPDDRLFCYYLELVEGLDDEPGITCIRKVANYLPSSGPGFLADPRAYVDNLTKGLATRFQHVPLEHARFHQFLVGTLSMVHLIIAAHLQDHCDAFIDRCVPTEAEVKARMAGNKVVDLPPVAELGPLDATKPTNMTGAMSTPRRMG